MKKICAYLETIGILRQKICQYVGVSYYYIGPKNLKNTWEKLKFADYQAKAFPNICELNLTRKITERKKNHGGMQKLRKQLIRQQVYKISMLNKEQQRSLKYLDQICRCGGSYSADKGRKKVRIGFKKRSRCRNCAGCLAKKCNVCTNCLNPKNKQACVKKICVSPILPKCPCFSI